MLMLPGISQWKGKVDSAGERGETGRGPVFESDPVRDWRGWCQELGWCAHNRKKSRALGPVVVKGGCGGSLLRAPRSLGWALM